MFVFFFVVAPLVELFVAYEVARFVGSGPVLLWTLASFVVGALVVRHEGVSVWKRVRRILWEGRLPGEEASDALLKLLAGVLLFLPGLITDVVGLFLLVPAVRTGARRWARRRWWPRVLERRGQVVVVEADVVDDEPPPTRREIGR